MFASIYIFCGVSLRKLVCVSTFATCCTTSKYDAYGGTYKPACDGTLASVVFYVRSIATGTLG